jgi:glycosyltransferase involved in cell wall biosynthesis
VILVDATPLQSEHARRGVGTYVRNLAEQLVRLAPEEVRFAVTAHGLDVLPAGVRDRATIGRRGHRPAQVYWVYNEWFLRRRIGEMRPAVFHATDFNGLVRTRTARTIATLHDLTALKQPRSAPGLSTQAAELRWQVYFRKLARAEHVIAVSEQVRWDAVSLLGLHEDRITVIPEGVDLRRFRPGADAAEFAAYEPYFLCVGGGNPNKNVRGVCRAFAGAFGAAGPERLLLAGDWAQLERQRLLRLAAELDVASRIHFLGYVSDGDLPGLYGHALALVFPSLEEGFGLPVLEAMACGTPVVTSSRGATTEVAGEAALLVDAHCVQDIARAMRAVFSAPELRADMIARGLKHALQFSWEETARRTLEVYQNVFPMSSSTKR